MTFRPTTHTNLFLRGNTNVHYVEEDPIWTTILVMYAIWTYGQYSHMLLWKYNRVRILDGMSEY